MRRALPRHLACTLLLTALTRAHPQDIKIPDTPEVLNIAPPPSDRFPARWYPRIGDGTDVLPAPVLDRPYTATVETLTSTGEQQTLQQDPKGFQARDRLGRTRTESVNGSMTIAGQAFKTKSILVADPVSHCQFQWLELTTAAAMPPESRVATVTCGPQTLRYKELDLYRNVIDSIPEGTVTRGDTTTKTEHLPTIQIDGLSVERLRVSNSRTDEHGQLKTWSAETWYSPDLKEIIRLGAEDDSYSGLTEIHRQDPDPKLFYPPAGYRIEPQPSR